MTHRMSTAILKLSGPVFRLAPLNGGLILVFFTCGHYISLVVMEMERPVEPVLSSASRDGTFTSHTSAFKYNVWEIS